MQVELETARRLIDSVLSRTRQLEVAVALKSRRLQRRDGAARPWRALRISSERLHQILNSHDLLWTRLGEGAAAAQAELEDRAFRAQEALSEIDHGQARLDEERLELWRDLEQIHERSIDLRADVPTEALERTPPPSGELETRLAQMERLWALVLEEDAAATRERAALAQIWNRLMAWVKGRLAGPDIQGHPYWARLAGRLQRMDARWSNDAGVFRSPEETEQIGFLRDRLSLLEAELEGRNKKLQETEAELKGRDEKLLELKAERDRIEEALSKAREETESTMRRLREEAGALEEERNRLAHGQETAQDVVEALKDKLRSVEMVLAATAAERDGFKRDLQAAQTNLDSAQEKAVRLEQECECLKRELESSKREAEKAKAASVPPSAPATPPVSAAQPAAPAPAPAPASVLPQLVESDVLQPIPSMELVEPSPESVWAKALGALRQSVSSAHAQLRRLATSGLTEGQRAIVRLAAAALGQAQDTLKIAGEFADEAGAAPSAGRVEAVVQSALSTWEPALRARGISVVRKLEPGVPEVSFQTETLRVALYQIIRNAYEAMSRGGCLTAQLRTDAGGASLSFSDTGGGFSKPALEKIFMPVEAARSGHLGLGLALVRRVMRRCGGDAEAANAPQGGAVVTLRFVSKPGAAALPPLAPSGSK